MATAEVGWLILQLVPVQYYLSHPQFSIMFFHPSVINPAAELRLCTEVCQPPLVTPHCLSRKLLSPPVCSMYPSPLRSSCEFHLHMMHILTAGARPSKSIQRPAGLVCVNLKRTVAVRGFLLACTVYVLEFNRCDLSAFAFAVNAPELKIPARAVGFFGLIGVFFFFR